MLLAAVNLLRNKPRLAAAERRPELAAGAAVLLRNMVSGEILLAVSAIFAAGLLSSLAPPSKALALVKNASARVGPGPVVQTVERDGYTLKFRVSPNRAALPNSFAVQVTRDGKPVNADVVARFAMLDMEMGTQTHVLPERAPGLYELSTPALVMVGHWGLSFEVTPPGQQPFTVVFVDRTTG